MVGILIATVLTNWDMRSRVVQRLLFYWRSMDDYNNREYLFTRILLVILGVTYRCPQHQVRHFLVITYLFILFQNASNMQWKPCKNNDNKTIHVSLVFTGYEKPHNSYNRTSLYIMLVLWFCGWLHGHEPVSPRISKPSYCTQYHLRHTLMIS